MQILLILISLFFINKILYKSYLNPIVIQTLVWATYYIILLLNIDFFLVGINKLNNYVLYQVLGFSIGGFICYLFTTYRRTIFKSIATNQIIDQTKQNIQGLFPYITVLLLFSIIGVVAISGSFSISKIADLRATLTDDDGKKYGLLGLIQSLLSVYLIVMLAVVKKMKLKYIVFLLAFIYFSLLLGGKGPFLFFFGGIFYVLVWQKRIKKIVLLYAVIGLIAMMAFITNLRFGDSGTSLSNNDVLKDVILTYAVASIPALEIAQKEKPKVFGYHTFRIAYVWLNKVGFNIPIDPVISKYVNTPLPTNTYTYLKPYYFDFGYLGIFILPLILGFFHNYIYFRASGGSLPSLILAALLLFPLILQILEEQYFRWITNWLYFSVFIIILTKLKMYGSRGSSSNV